MPTTTLTEFTGAIDSIAARTDAAGAAVDDWSAEERRMNHMLFGSGVFLTTHWQVVAGAAATMNVVVGSGSAQTDLAMVPGLNVGQGKYLVRMDEVSKTVTLNAADPSLGRRDEIYLVVSDNLYDGSGRSLPRLALRTGDASGSPAAPGPDANWDAYLLLAEVLVPGGAADILGATITDKRVIIIPAIRVDHGQLFGNGDDDHTQYYNAARHTKAVHDALALDHGALSGKTDDDHTQYYNATRHTKAVHDALDIDADTVDGLHSTAFVRTSGSSEIASGVLTLNRNSRSVALNIASNSSVNDADQAHIQFLADTGDGSKIVGYRYDLSTRMGIKIYGYNGGNIEALEIDYLGRVFPTLDNVKPLGTPVNRWTEVWAVDGTINTSDAEAKEDIQELSAASAGAIIDGLAPIEFRHKGRVRKHWSFAAQDVSAALLAAGINPSSYGVYIDPAVAGEEDAPKGIRSHELIPILWASLREVRQRVSALEAI